MSEMPAEVPPVRAPGGEGGRPGSPPLGVAPGADLWSGLPPQGPPPGRPLTYGERELLSAFLRFREKAPSQGWLLMRGVVNGLVMAILFGVLIGVGWFATLGVVAPFASDGAEADGYFWLAIALVGWFGLIFGFLVRDQVDLRRTVSVWHIVMRVLKFDLVERLLASGMLLPAEEVERDGGTPQ